MDLRHLRYFIAVAEEMHFGRAARRLGMSQPPLSQQIRALEDDLDVRLFERTSRRVLLTEAGRLFLAEARKVLGQADHAADVARRAAGGEIGELAAGFVSSAPLIETIAAAFRRFRQAYPRVHLTLRELPADAQIAALAEHELDVGFVRAIEPPLLPSELSARLLIEEGMMVALRKDHPLAVLDRIRISDLADQPFVLYERSYGAGFNEQLERLCRANGFAPDIIQETSGLATLLGLVAAGFGITIIARSLSAIHLDSLTYRPLDEPEAISRLWIVTHDRPSIPSRYFQTILAQIGR